MVMQALRLDQSDRENLVFEEEVVLGTIVSAHSQLELAYVIA